MTGRRYERKMVHAAADAGVEVLLSGGSGSGTDDDRPDFVAGAGGALERPLGGEAKTCKSDAFTIPRSEAEQLQRWCESFGAVPAVAVYWKGPDGGNTSYGGWWIRHLDAVRVSPAENSEGTHHLRPRREDRRSWASWDDVAAGDLRRAPNDPQQQP